MTLQEWERANGERTMLHHPGLGARFIYYGINPNRKELWHLSDWRVTSVSGGTIWLLPREE